MSNDRLRELEDRIKALEEESDRQFRSLKTATPPNVPIGTILPYAGPIDREHPMPDSWRLCNGAALERAGDFEVLFQKLGTAWGTGDGQNTFNLPDLRGMFLRGVDLGAGEDPESAARAANRNGGNSGDAVGSIQGNATSRPAIPFQTDNPGNHNHDSGGFNLLVRVTGEDTVHENTDRSGGEIDIRRGRLIEPNGQHTHLIVGGGDIETRPRNVCVNWVIRVK